MPAKSDSDVMFCLQSVLILSADTIMIWYLNSM